MIFGLKKILRKKEELKRYLLPGRRKGGKKRII
jgi:hypothetical protein